MTPTAHDAPAGPVLLPVADRHQMVAELRRLSVGRRRGLAGTAVLLMASAGFGLVFPLTVGAVVDTVSAADGQGVPARFWWQLTLLGAAVVLTGLFEFAGVVVLARLAEGMLADLRERYVDAALHLPQSVVEQVGAGDVVSRSASDVREISQSLPDVLPRLAALVFTFVLSFVGLFAVDWRFAVALLVSVPLYVLAARWYLRTGPAVYAAERAAESGRSQQVLTTVQSLPTVAAFGLAEPRAVLARAATWQLVRWAMRARIVQNQLFSRTNVAEGTGLLLVLATGFALAAAGHVTLGAVTSAALLYFRVILPVGELLFVMDDLQSAIASFARVAGVTAAATPAVPARHRPAPAPGSGSGSGSGAVVSLSGVSFGYRAGHPVLQGIDLQIDAAERVALVGSTGSGKTTLARLIAGTHEPTHGQLDRAVAREGISFLNQEHHVFAGTVRENLTLARPDADDAELLEALGTVGAVRLLDSLPEGLDTEVGGDGHRLTPSQAQHLALARLVLADPVLAILDEATAEADSRDAGVLQEATDAALAGRTGLVIAHRLTQAEQCDRVVVMHHGRIVEVGPHDELVARGGRYAQLWAAWTGGDPENMVK